MHVSETGNQSFVSALSNSKHNYSGTNRFPSLKVSIFNESKIDLKNPFTDEKIFVGEDRES